MVTNVMKKIIKYHQSRKRKLEDARAAKVPQNVTLHRPAVHFAKYLPESREYRSRSPARDYRSRSPIQRGEEGRARAAPPPRACSLQASGLQLHQILHNIDST